MTKTRWMVAVCATLLWTGTALAAPTPQQKCDGARLRAWAKYASCVENILAKEAGGQNPPVYEASAKCRHKYFRRWATLQGAAYQGSTCIGSRFTDNGNGTVTDKLSGLTWEKKTNDGSVRDKDNLYSWSTPTSSVYAEDGTAFTSFLGTLNAGGGFGGANGWRVPTLAELQTIVLDFPCSTPSCPCPSIPCVDPALDVTTTEPYQYWSATTYVPAPATAWVVYFEDLAVVSNAGKLSSAVAHVRAVRGGL